MTEGGIVGILLSYLYPRFYSLHDLLVSMKKGLVPLSEADKPLRAKWADQIQEALKDLHKVGVIWGEAKTDNVIIDIHQNAVITDFARSSRVGLSNGQGSFQGQDILDFQKILKELL